MKPQPLLTLRPPNEHYQKQNLDLPVTDARRDAETAMLELLAILFLALIITVGVFVGYWLKYVVWA